MSQDGSSIQSPWGWTTTKKGINYWYKQLLVWTSKALCCMGEASLKNPWFHFHDCLKRISSVQLLSCAWLFATPWTAACQASLSITSSQSPPKPMSIKSVMPSNHVILCRPLLLLSSIFPSIRVFSNESALCTRWPKYWSSASTSVPPMNTQDWSPLGWTGWIALQSKGLSRVFSNTTVQKHQFFGAQLSL